MRALGIYSLFVLVVVFNFGFYNDQFVEGYIVVELVQTIVELGDLFLYVRVEEWIVELRDRLHELDRDVSFDELVVVEAEVERCGEREQ